MWSREHFTVISVFGYLQRDPEKTPSAVYLNYIISYGSLPWTDFVRENSLEIHHGFWNIKFPKHKPGISVSLAVSSFLYREKPRWLLRRWLGKMKEKRATWHFGKYSYNMAHHQGNSQIENIHYLWESLTKFQYSLIRKGTQCCKNHTSLFYKTCF